MAIIGALLLLPLLLLTMEVFVRSWRRAPNRSVQTVSRPRQTRPGDETSHRALLVAEAAAVHQLLGGQIDTATYHQRMHQLACRDDLTPGAPS